MYPAALTRSVSTDAPLPRRGISGRDFQGDPGKVVEEALNCSPVIFGEATPLLCGRTVYTWMYTCQPLILQMMFGVAF